jgi:hypothetical protein
MMYTLKQQDTHSAWTSLELACAGCGVEYAADNEPIIVTAPWPLCAGCDGQLRNALATRA